MSDCVESPCPCGDCRIATHPFEDFMVLDAVWAAAGNVAGSLCISCLEERLDRALEPADFRRFRLTTTSPWTRSGCGSGRAAGGRPMRYLALQRSRWMNSMSMSMSMSPHERSTSRRVCSAFWSRTRALHEKPRTGTTHELARRVHAATGSSASVGWDRSRRHGLSSDAAADRGGAPCRSGADHRDASEARSDATARLVAVRCEAASKQFSNARPGVLTVTILPTQVDPGARIRPGSAADPTSGSFPKRRAVFGLAVLHRHTGSDGARHQLPDRTATSSDWPTVRASIMSVAKNSRRKERRRSLPLTPEIRHYGTPGLEARAGSSSNEIVVSGKPAVYATSYSVLDHLGEFEETIEPGAATDVLARGADIRFLINHTGLALARTASRTLTVFDTPTALTFEARLDSRSTTSYDLAVAIERGDCDAMSISFRVARDKWSKDLTQRTIHSFAEVSDVSAVTYPASPTTSIEIAQRMAMEQPIESRARLRAMVAGARAGRLSESEIEALRGFLRVEAADSSAGLEPRRQADPVVKARLQVESSRRHRQSALLADIAKRQRRRPAAGGRAA